MDNLPGSEDKEITGGCFCKHITFSARGPWSVQCCHCNLCRHVSGAAFAHNVLMSADNFKFTSEKTPENGGAIVYPSSDKIKRISCAKCGGYVAGDAHGYGVYAVSIGQIDGIDSAVELPEFLRPQRHIFYGDRIADVNDGLTKHSTFPGMEGNVESV